MRNILAITAGLLEVIASLPYIRDSLKRKTKPNMVTWLTWTLLGVITTSAAISAGAVQTAIFAGAVTICNVAIWLSSLRFGIRRYTIFDVVCQLLAISGIILWQLTSQPALAIVFVIVSDFIGALPTYRHIWLQPYEETLSTFVLDAVSSALAVGVVANFRFVSVAYPFYIFVSALSFALLIIFCRRQSARE